jgi:hypothetical protein
VIAKVKFDAFLPPLCDHIPVEACLSLTDNGCIHHLGQDQGMEVAVATATHHNAEAGPSRLRPPTLPFTLDLTCPIALPPRPAGEVSWPYHVA